MCSIQIEPVLETQRLRLRRPRMTDAPRVAKLLNDRELARMTNSIPHPYGLEDAQDYLAQAEDAESRAMSSQRRSHVPQHPSALQLRSAGH